MSPEPIGARSRRALTMPCVSVPVEAERAAERQHRLADLDLVGVAERQRPHAASRPRARRPPGRRWRRRRSAARGRTSAVAEAHAHAARCSARRRRRGRWSRSSRAERSRSPNPVELPARTVTVASRRRSATRTRWSSGSSAWAGRARRRPGRRARPGRCRLRGYAACRMAVLMATVSARFNCNSASPSGCRSLSDEPTKLWATEAGEFTMAGRQRRPSSGGQPRGRVHREAQRVWRE